MLETATLRNEETSCWEDGNEAHHDGRHCIGCGHDGDRRARAGSVMDRADESKRCPSKWGAADERGSGNHMKPASVLNAVKLIKTGEVIELAHVLGPHAVLRHAPLRHARQAHLHERRLERARQQRGDRVSEIGQVGTQFDGFAHQTHRNSWYNCFKVDENRGARRVQQARHPQCRRPDHARRADRRRRLQGRRDAGRHLRDHRRGSRRRAQEAEHDPAAGRRRHHQHRLGQALRQGQPALREVVPGNRGEGGGMARRPRTRC